MPGSQRAAILMLALGPEHGAHIWKQLEEDEIRDLSVAISRLGMIDSKHVEAMLVDFVQRMSAAGAVMGSFDSTERLLQKFLPSDRVSNIMEEIRGPAGRNMWEKLSNVQEEVLANYLKNEYPQTVAVVLSKIRSDHAARVLSLMPDEFALEVVRRMLSMESVQKEILEKVEQTLRTEFMSSLAQTRRRDSHEVMADIFNAFDRQTESRFLTALEEQNRESAERIKSLMFTFEDLGKLDPASIQTLVRQVDTGQLAIALKGASDGIKETFLSNMSQRAGKLLRDDMDVMGPVRLKEVDDSQSAMVRFAKELADRGDIMISKNKGEDELVY
ncbi:MAG: flagellar motor switch protein FliG [Pseudomonadota bacterium]